MYRVGGPSLNRHVAAKKPVCRVPGDSVGRADCGRLRGPSAYTPPLLFPLTHGKRILLSCLRQRTNEAFAFEACVFIICKIWMWISLETS